LAIVFCLYWRFVVGICRTAVFVVFVVVFVVIFVFVAVVVADVGCMYLILNL